MVDLHKLVGHNIQKFRKNKGLTQQELADKIGSNQKTLSDWERGRSEVSLNNMQKICEALGVPLNSLINSEDNNDITNEVKELKTRISILEKLINNEIHNRSLSRV